MNIFSPDIVHDEALNKKPLLAFDEKKDFWEQKKNITGKLKLLLGNMPEEVNLNVQVEFEKEYEYYIEKRFTFDSEKYVKAVCHLWVPKTGKKKYPLVICLQGHSTGMHISMGRAVFAGDEEIINGGDRDFACQAVKRGYAALIIEQRGMGERRTDKMTGDGPRCHVTSMTALLLGRTMIGERVWDIKRSIDAVKEFGEIDMDNIACMGNSGGGTAAYYAACMDERIKLVMPSCSVCTYKDSICAMHHCVCNYIPGIVQYMDMGDLSAAIAPRKLLVVAGKDDPIFPKDGVEKAYETIKKVYKSAGVPENCSIVWGDEGHRFYADKAWNVFENMIK